MKWIINNNRHNIPIDSFILCIRLLVRASVLKEMNVCVPHEVTRIIIQWNWLSFRFGSHYQFFIIFFYCFLPLPIFFPCWIFFFFVPCGECSQQILISDPAVFFVCIYKLAPNVCEKCFSILVCLLSLDNSV